MKTTMKKKVTADVLRMPQNLKCENKGVAGNVIRFLNTEQLLKRDLWKRFVEQYRQPDADANNGWRCEYWGKMMMGGCFICQVNKDDALYAVLEETVCDMLETQREDGRISTYAENHQFRGWDLWGRKYVMLGMEYFLEFCKDEKLAERIKKSLCNQMDAILQYLGDGKTPVCDASDNYRGLNSSSILEAVVRLYRLSGNVKYLQFAQHIVDCGGTSICDIFERAYQDKFYPYQYPMTKAYEMISCFEGLIEYWRVTGDEKCKTAALRFTDRLLESDFTVIGSCGCTHEFLDHSTVRQANELAGPLMQETCVTVSIMKMLWQVMQLTGDAKYAEAFERSFYNAYLGSINTEKNLQSGIMEEFPELIHEPLPFDSYSPLTAGYRGRATGGFQIMSDGHYYGCCACIGATGSGLFEKMQLMENDEGLALLLYEAGRMEAITPGGQKVKLSLETNYPSDGRVNISVSLAKPESFSLWLRIPAWSKKSTLLMEGIESVVQPGFLKLEHEWKDGEHLELTFERDIKILRPIPYGRDVLMTGMVWEKDYAIPVYEEEPENMVQHLAIQVGPLMMAAEQKNGWNPEDIIDLNMCVAKEPRGEHLCEVDLLQKDGTSIALTAYADAGKQWGSNDVIAVWLRCR